MRRTNLTGMVFGRLSVVEKDIENYISPTKWKVSKWVCKCSCGTILSVRGDSLRNGHTKSCGCLRRELKQKSFGEATLNAVFRDYVNSAKYRGYSFLLSKEYFKEVVAQPCHYCGALPTPRYRYRTNGECVVNGVDRIDNSKGYEEDNVVPCCSRCNIAKASLSKSDFLNLVKEIYSRHFLILSKEQT